MEKRGVCKQTDGLWPLACAIVFAANSIGLGLGAEVSVRLLKTDGPRKVMRATTSLQALSASLLLVSEISGRHSLPLVYALFFMMVTALGGIMPSCNAIAGTAAALMGALGFGAGALTHLSSEPLRTARRCRFI